MLGWLFATHRALFSWRCFGKLTANTGDDGVVAAFPNLPEASLPTEPMALHMSPDGTKWWIAGLEGIIKEVRRT